MQEKYQKWIRKYSEELRMKERSAATIEKYTRAVTLFADWLGSEKLNKEKVIEWKKKLSEDMAPITVNTFLSALNGFFRMIRREDCCVSFLKVQRRVFRDPEIELDRKEYEQLVRAAKAHQNQRGVMLLETICATGIRVSETAYITVEAAKQGRVEINLKGKIRTIMFPRELSQKLLAYAKKENIHEGAVFRDRRGKPMTRRQIWGELKKVCALTRIDPKKVFPHNLRHLFAREFYKKNKDVVQLADLLGHSSIETTRIYLMTSGEEHLRKMEGLGFLL